MKVPKAGVTFSEIVYSKQRETSGRAMCITYFATEYNDLLMKRVRAQTSDLQRAVEDLLLSLGTIHYFIIRWWRNLH